jgi:hypothetical protein
MNALAIAFLKSFVIPEILAIVQRRQAANLTITSEDIIAELHARVGAVVEAGTIWLDSNPST